MKIGIDVGGTNTDAVLMEGGQVLAWTKQPTSPDILKGISTALEVVLAGRNRDAIERVVIGTTHFVNAFVQRRDLARIGVMRIGSPAASSFPPLCDWPSDLRAVIDADVRLIRGGHHVHGDELVELDEVAIRDAAASFRVRDVEAVAVTSIFSSIDSSHEQRAVDMIADALPGRHITLSSAIGRIGLLERENAAIINALVAPMARSVITAFQQALDRLGIEAPLFISQNDGTMVGASQAARYPVLTFASGPTNSMRGAALLSGGQDGVIVDIGGTTADIGVLAGGYPRSAGGVVKIGDIRTNFRMPDLLSVGIGGGSIVRSTRDGVRVGPDSLGYRLLSEGVAFGGDVLTATDLAIAAGGFDIGDLSAVANLEPGTVSEGMRAIRTILDDAIDQMKTSPGPVPITLVGGGAILVQSDLAAGDVVRPDHYAVANAVGAALAQIGGEVDRVMDYGPGRDIVLALAIQEAREQAVSAGADPDTVATVEIDEIPISYLPGNSVRVRVRTIGDC